MREAEIVEPEVEPHGRRGVVVLQGERIREACDRRVSFAGGTWIAAPSPPPRFRKTVRPLPSVGVRGAPRGRSACVAGLTVCPRRDEHEAIAHPLTEPRVRRGAGRRTRRRRAERPRASAPQRLRVGCRLRVRREPDEVGFVVDVARRPCRHRGQENSPSPTGCRRARRASAPQRLHVGRRLRVCREPDEVGFVVDRGPAPLPPPRSGKQSISYQVSTCEARLRASAPPCGMSSSCTS
jgi:hypothetical protein